MRNRLSSSPSAAPTTEVASLPVRGDLEERVVMATLWLSQRESITCCPLVYINFSSEVRERALLGSPLTLLVVFSFAIFTPDMYCLSVFRQMAPWSSAQKLANGGAPAASSTIPLL